MNLSRLAAATGFALVVLAPALARSDTTADVADLYRQSYRLEAQNKAAQAVDAMKKIRARGGSSYFADARTAWLEYLAGRYADSARSYRKAIADKPKAIEPKLGLTLPLLAAHKWRELEVACRAVLKQDPKNAIARARLAHAYYSRGNYPDSATLYRGLVADYPANLDHRTGLGWALARMGRGREAKAIFAAVLAVSPDNANARRGMALP